ncbi:restriction endonuclease subunit S [Methylotenera oryzisoli]|uniref:Restriction endonuclease subunit S n=1 Tax=Methylotenera oryzisoli TaxID=2080758 RepID=A0A4Y9VTI0_9PROT|nr:restriction endonuclease subunit S [Methylotenera oryzisoli]TFW72328.1 restriction endonuclease subunit S [Methylotenera oryzisoli]
MIKNKLKDISLSISSGLTPLRSNNEFWLNGEIPWLKTEQLGEKYIYHTNEHITKNALNKTSIKINPENTLSIAMYGEGKTRGNLSILKSPMTTNQACCNVVIDPSKAHYEYIYYYLKTQYEEIRNLSSGVRKNLNSNDIKNYPIRLPSSLDIQFSIANVLKSLDNKIELNNRINANLEAMAKTLYDYWFVQFDFPDANGKPYKTSGGKMVYNQTLKREIPEGWTTEPLTKSCDVVDCLHSKKPDFYNESEDAYLLQLDNITDSRQINLEQKYFVSKHDYSEWTSRIEVKHFDIVMTNAGRIAAFAQVPKGIRCGIGRNITAIRPNNIKPNYFYMSLSGNDIQKQILSNLDHGAFFKSFNVKGIKKLFLTRPIDNIESKFEELISPIIEKRNAALAENAKLASLCDWLLPMLMNGQVTVKG